MGSSNMKDIKRRIKSVESTMQITKAMELVASSKLRKAKIAADKAQPFFNTLYDVMRGIMASNTDFSSPFTAIRERKSVLLVVIAGDRGLAGGFNTNVLKPAYARCKALQSAGVRVTVLCLGKKAVEFFEKRDIPSAGAFSNIGEGMTIYYAKAISERVVSGYKFKEFDAVELFYNSFLSAMSQELRQMEVLPVSKVKDSAAGKNEESARTSATEYDPSPEAVFDSIVPQYITGLLFGAVVDSFAAEQAARRTAMENASDNAEEMIDSLSLMYNRARQASITQEITEIVSGAQALS